jgi:4-amino-4-deoxy-L-arabinose transferase-like glycosyltransferase
MADDSLVIGRSFRGIRLLRWLIGILLLYWGILALVLPVTTWDSQVYNLGRLAVIDNAGFWQGSAWNSVRQVAFPWVFDAVHYPFLKLGWGTALPNFLCFIGLTVILFDRLSKRFDESAAYWSILILLAMPTLMLQATTTKNDFVIVFCCGCWFFALSRFQEGENKVFLFFAALSLGFAVGSKTSAIPVGAILSFVSIVWLRKYRNAVLTFGGFLLPSLILFGSVETYLLNWHLYHQFLGPEDFIARHANHDGLQGTLANFIRYYFGNISFAIFDYKGEMHLTSFLEGKCRDLLHSIGLRNVGYSIDANDQTMQFLRSGYDSGADFGLTGCLAMIFCTFLCLKPRLRSPAFVLAGVGFVQLGLNAWLIAWMPWNDRFLCGSFVAFGVATAMVVFSGRSKHKIITLSSGILVVIAAIRNPALCRERDWSAVKASISHRMDLTFDQHRIGKPVYQEVLQLHHRGFNDWFLVAGSDSWILPFLTIKGIRWTLAPGWNGVPVTKTETPISCSKADVASGQNILVLNCPIPATGSYEVISSFPEATYILRAK